jgi:hypothetical protein
MREIRQKLEYVIDCKCGSRYAYNVYDINKGMRCQRCGTIHQFDGSHDVYILEKININYPVQKKLVDNSTKKSE